MKLKDIAIEASIRADVPVDDPAFRCVAHHVAQLFLAKLPPRLDFDGSSRIEIRFGPRGQSDKYRCDHVFGVSVYYCEEFDFGRFYEEGDAKREEWLLRETSSAFLDMAQGNAAKTATILAAAENVRASGFSLRIHSKKLSRLSVCRKYRLDVFRCLNRDVGESWAVEITHRRNPGKPIVAWLNDPPGCLDMRPHYKKSAWDGEDFVIWAWDRVLRRLDPQPYYDKLESG